MLITRRELMKNLALAAFGVGTVARFGWALELDPQDDDYVILYDTYAIALYMDGSLGPKTGIIRVDDILENQTLIYPFWHGHSGKTHEFQLTPDHFSQLKGLQKIHIETTSVDGHTHWLFIDPKDPKWRVPGALPVKVPIP